VRLIIEQFNGDGLLTTSAKEAACDSLLPTQIIDVLKYQSLADLVQKSESSTYCIRDAIADIQSLDFDNDPANIKPYIAKRLAKNDITKVVNMERSDIAPATYAMLQACQPTSTAVERSFSVLKHMLRKDRHFLPTNLKWYSILHFNNIP